MKKWSAGALCAVLLCAVLPVRGAEVLTGNIPPFSIEKGERPGFVREIVAAMAKEVGVALPVTYMHWPTAQETAKTRLDTIIFPLARTKTREPHYNWIQKILDMDVAFATAPGKPTVTTDAQAKALGRVGVRLGAPMEGELKKLGYTNLVVIKASTDLAKALQAGEIDAWYAPAPEIAFNWAELKLAGVPQFGLKYSSVPLYVAASKNIPGIDMEKWRQAYVRLEQNGTVSRILASYGLR